MIPLIPFLLAGNQTPYNAVVPPFVNELLAESNFGNPSKSTSGQWTFTHSSRPARLIFQLQEWGQPSPSPGNLGGVDKFSAARDPKPENKRLLSGLKFGAGPAGHRQSYGEYGDNIVVGGVYSRCQLYLRYKVTKSDGRPVATGYQEGDEELFEGIARWTFGLLEGSHCGETSMGFAGHNYPAFRDTEDKLHISASAFATNTGRTLTINRNAGRAYMSTANGGVLLALGCPEVKIGSQWHPIKTVVMARNDQILLPVELLSLIE